MPDEFKPLTPAALTAGLALGDEGALAQKRREAAVRSLSVTRAGQRAATRAVATGEIPAAFSSELDPGWTSCQIHGAQGVRAVDPRTGEYSETGTLCEFCYKQEWSAEQRAARTLEVADQIKADREALEAAVLQLVADEARARAEFDAAAGVVSDDVEHGAGAEPVLAAVPDEPGPAQDRQEMAGADAGTGVAGQRVADDPFDAWMDRI